MANVGNGVVEQGCELDILLHPELLSRDFLLLSLEQKKIVIDDALNDKEKLTRIFVQHAMPLPQRNLPKSRWGRIMESKREQKKSSELQKSVTADCVRKRPLIVFDGTSTSTSIKVKKTENGDSTQRLQPSSTESANHVPQKLGGKPTSPTPRVFPPSHGKETKSTTVNNDGHTEDSQQTDKTPVNLKSNHPAVGCAVKIKRAAPKEETSVANDLRPTEPKKKIQHVTWP